MAVNDVIGLDYGTLSIMDAYEAGGVCIENVYACGGIGGCAFRRIVI